MANSQWVTYLFFIRALTCKTHNDRMFPLKTADDISLYYLLQNSGIEDDYTKLKLLKDVLCIYSSHTYESENYFPSLWLFKHRFDRQLDCLAGTSSLTGPGICQSVIYDISRLIRYTIEVGRLIVFRYRTSYPFGAPEFIPSF